ncbi:MAG: NapC/NirT family cytochrome c [Opitutaceae bacterium]|nr:NapC/NirT family cytochrome c [Opitutaceae bacterium]
MPDPLPPTPDPASPSRHALWRNWISLTGVIIGGGSLFAFLFLFAIDLFSGSHNPYIGILSYVVAPAFLIFGLVVFVVGAWIQHRQLKRYPDAPPARLYIDFERPHDRKVMIYFGAGAMAFLLLTAMGSYQTYHVTESVEFCGQVCHKVMKPEFVTYQRGVHARVACVECHIGSGAKWYVKSKLSGSYQLYSVAFNKYSRPIGTPVHNLRPAQDTCEKCHWPEKYTGNLDRTYAHYLADEASTPHTVRMLLHIGGGSDLHGPVGGIHWHTSAANKVEYFASDPQRQRIPWVRVTSFQGKTTVYRSPDYQDEPPADQIRRMDCIDCHNRPAHRYQTPNAAVDQALELGRLDAKLPAIKRQAVELLTSTYASENEAIAKITASLREEYAGRPGLDQAVTTTSEIYRANFFPEMKADWSKYPDNKGHKDFPGCFRCHDNQHEAVGDPSRMIAASDCTTCHSIVTQGKGEELANFSLKGLSFQHPGGDIPDGVICNDCHNGKNQ